MSFESRQYTGVVPSTTTRGSGTAPSSLSAHSNPTADPGSGLEQSTLDEAAQDDTVDGLVIMHETLHFGSAQRDKGKDESVHICDSCHWHATKSAFPQDNYVVAIGKYTEKYRTDPPTATTFSAFPHLRYRDGTWQCPHSSIWNAFLDEHSSAFGNSMTTVTVHCLWGIDPTCPMGGHLVCFHRNLKAFKEAALRVPGLTEAQKAHISDYQG